MNGTSRAGVAGPQTRTARRWWAGVLLLMAVMPGARAGWAQSCSGKVAGDVCRAAAGACDVAETCVATGGGGVGAPLYQPTDGSLLTDVARDFTAGYAFTPNKALTVTARACLFNGPRTVYLYNRLTGAVLASASVTSANGGPDSPITPVTLDGRDLLHRRHLQLRPAAPTGSGLTLMPSVQADASIVPPRHLLLSVQRLWSPASTAA